MEKETNSNFEPQDSLLSVDEWHRHNFEKTTDCNDTALRMRIKLSLFMQLCVQASKCEKLPQLPFQELLQKFKDKKIVIKEDDKENYIDMTSKDGCHRLMSYIPLIGNENEDNGIFFMMVNGKNTSLIATKFSTEEDIIETRKAREKDKKYRDDHVGPFFINACYAYRCSGEMIVETGKPLEQDKEHHGKIVKDFQQLLDK
jgi:hypothetical protein